MRAKTRPSDANPKRWRRFMNVMKSMIIAGALGAVMASPALAQRQGIGENAPQINTPAGATHSRTTAIRRGYPRSAYRARAQANPGRLAGDPRAEALRECTEDSRNGHSRPGAPWNFSGNGPV